MCYSSSTVIHGGRKQVNRSALLAVSLSAHLSESRGEVREFVSEYLRQKRRDLERIGRWGTDVSDRLLEFTTGGKMIRGSLVLLGADLFGRPRDGEEIKVAAAVELMQSSLLVHDDIMDRDEMRRGMASVYSQYSRLGRSQGLPDPSHFGESMGICAGDVAIFTAFELLGELEGPATPSIISLCSKEMTYVGVAQMQDVFLGQSEAAVDEGDVYLLYLYKTGRYTFSLPLMLGSLLAGASERTVDSMARLGERLGVVFQMKDDEIGLFGESEETGKPCGTDIKEGKKTLYHLHLMRSASEEQRPRLRAIFGNRSIGNEEVEYVRNLIVDLGIRDHLAAEMVRLADEAHAIADGLDGVAREQLSLIHDLIEYNLTRKM